jgi:hypothetical protein
MSVTVESLDILMQITATSQSKRTPNFDKGLDTQKKKTRLVQTMKLEENAADKVTIIG